jgi:hypothetical protein
MVFSFLSHSLVLLPLSLSLLISCQFVSIYLPFSVFFSALITQSTCPPWSQLHTYSAVCELQSLPQQTHITKSSCLTSNNPSSSIQACPPARLSACPSLLFCIIYLGPHCICFLYSLLSFLHLAILLLTVIIFLSMLYIYIYILCVMFHDTYIEGNEAWSYADWSSSSHKRAKGKH